VNDGRTSPDHCTRESLMEVIEMAETLVICTHCKAMFPSPIVFGDRKSFQTSTLKGNTVTCPECGTIVPCNKENMIFKE